MGATNDATKKVWLLGRLKGGAQAWQQSKGTQLANMDYQAVKDELIEHFQGEEVYKLRKLQACRQGGRSLMNYNEEYTQLAAGCTNVAYKVQIKDIYLDGLADAKLREALDLHSGSTSLQRLMEMAMSHTVKFSTKGKGPNSMAATTTTTQRPQNPARKQCSKCNWWYNPSRGESCKCKENAKGGRPKPRVNEADLEVAEGAVDVDCEGCEGCDRCQPRNDNDSTSE